MPASEHGHVITLEPPGNGRQCAGSFSHAYLPTYLLSSCHTPTPRQSQTLCAQSTRDCETSLCVRGRDEVRWLLFHFYFCSGFVLESLPICPAPATAAASAWHGLLCFSLALSLKMCLFRQSATAYRHGRLQVLP